MLKACDKAVAAGVEAIASGDLFLEDIRRYREDSLRVSGLIPLFPIWGLETRSLLREMIASGVKACIVCVDPKKRPGEFAGRDLDDAFPRELPAGIAPCGEDGEFHTCVYDGPMFREAIPIESGEVVERDGFVFADVRLIK
jgi:diphthamide synthase (EF-2-diphthine--ammonia ligase)